MISIQRKLISKLYKEMRVRSETWKERFHSLNEAVNTLQI